MGMGPGHRALTELVTPFCAVLSTLMARVDMVPEFGCVKPGSESPRAPIVPRTIPFPVPEQILGPLTNTPSFECRSGPASTPIACPALIREGTRRVCRTPIPLGVATASCPPTKRRPRVSRARHATPEWSPRPLEPAGGPWRGISKGSSCLGPHKPNRVSRVPRPTATRGHDSIRFAAANQSRKNEKEVAMGVLVRTNSPTPRVGSLKIPADFADPS